MAEFTEEATAAVWSAAHTAPAVDARVFFDPPGHSRPGLSGLDALLTTPEILAEFFRRRAFRGEKPRAPFTSHEDYVRSLTPDELADIVWRQLFVDNAPVSEPARVVLTTLGMFGLDVASADLRLLREQYAAIPEAERLDKALTLANVRLVLHPVESMDAERYASRPRHRAFRPVLCLNDLLGDWKESARKLRRLGFGLKTRVDDFAPLELRRHLSGEIDRLAPAALALDWPGAGARPEDEGVGRLLRESVLPLCGERGLGFMLAAGDEPVDRLSPLWDAFPGVKFALFPGREEHFLPAAVSAFNSRNVLLCGPDQPLSYPRALESNLRLRLETLGSMFHACHSGASAAEGLVGCWAHMRWTLGRALIRRYSDLWRTGWRYSDADVAKDVSAVLGGNIAAFFGLY